MLQYICIRIYYTDARLLILQTMKTPYVQLNTERKISFEILISEKKIKRHKERKLEQRDSGKKFPEIVSGHISCLNLTRY